VIRPWPLAFAAVLLCIGLSLAFGLTPVTGALFGISLGAGALGVVTDRGRR
jgi:hypothetical protein